MNMNGNVKELFSIVSDYWSPKVIGEVNDSYIKIAKLKGEFVWHDHDKEDEMFYVIKGSLTIELENEVIILNEGDFYIVKKGVMHNPIAKEECWVMIIEQKSAKHTGNVLTDKTKSIEEQL